MRAELSVMADIRKFPKTKMEEPPKVRIYCPRCGGEAWAVFGSADDLGKTQIVEIVCLGCPVAIKAGPKKEGSH